jgi:hypothetical protein
MASVFVLVARSPNLDGWSQYGVFLVAFFLALGSTFQLIFNENRSAERVENALAALALAAAVIGQPMVSVSLGILTLTSSSMLSFARFSDRWRTILVLGVLLLFAFFPMVSVQTGGSSISMLIATLLVEAAVLVGWIRLAYEDAEQSSPYEAWMRVLRMLGLIFIPAAVAFLLLTFLGGQEDTAETLWWGTPVVLLITGMLFLIINRFSKKLPVSFIRRAHGLFSLGWIQIGLDWMFAVTSWILRIMSRVLEGRAGVLWALLVIALLLSLASQIAIGG